MHRTCHKFVLRAGYVTEKLKFAGLGAGLLAIAIGGGLTGCAEDPNYPSLSKISDLSGIMTPEERQKAVQDMQRQDQARGAEPVKTASK